MGWDAAIQHWLNHEAASPALDALFVLVSVLGSFVPYLVIGVLAARAHGRRRMVAFLVTLVVAELVVTLLKGVVGRARPTDARVLLAIGTSLSMPSGHAARAFAGWVALWPLGRRWRIGAGVFAFLTLASRVYVGAHWPSDVLVGALVGLLVGLVVKAAVDAWGFESDLTKPQRAPELARVWDRIRATALRFARADYLYTLRLLGRVSGEQAARLSRLSTYWGLVRFFGPILAIVASWVLYLGFFPHLATTTSKCLAGYFLPFGIEIGVPLCVRAGIPWWLVVATIAYIDGWIAVFFTLNFDFLHRVPKVGRWLERAQARGAGFIAKRPWIGRLQFLGIASFVLLPVSGTGVIGGILVGRTLGLGRAWVWAAVMTGTVVRVSAYGLAATGLLHLL